MSSQFSEISITEFAELFNEQVFLIDVRETDEYLDGHVPGAIHIPLNEVPNRVEEFRNPQGEPPTSYVKRVVAARVLVTIWLRNLYTSSILRAEQWDGSCRGTTLLKEASPSEF